MVPMSPDNRGLTLLDFYQLIHSLLALLSLLRIFFCGNLSLLISYAMLMRPKKVETDVHGC